jgi:Cu2+-exporting ATPase
VLIKNAEALENMNKVNVLITDKTGTITEGNLRLKKYLQFRIMKRTCCNSLSLNQYSEHPLAQAVVNFANKKYRFTRSQKTLRLLKGVIEP